MLLTTGYLHDLLVLKLFDQHCGETVRKYARNMKGGKRTRIWLNVVCRLVPGGDTFSRGTVAQLALLAAAEGVD